MAPKVSPRLRDAHGKPCPYCGLRMDASGFDGKAPNRHTHPRFPTRDHVLPRCAGGSKGPVLVVCVTCNGDKGSRSIRTWRAHLSRRGDPRAPFLDRLLARLERDPAFVQKVVAVVAPPRKPAPKQLSDDPGKFKPEERSIKHGTNEDCDCRGGRGDGE